MWFDMDSWMLNKFLWKFKNSIYWILCWLIHSLTHSLMPSAKHNLAMDVATGLISSLFDVALSRDVPFRQPQDVQCMHHGLIFVLLCVPVLFAEVSICGSMIWLPSGSGCFLPIFSESSVFTFLLLLFVCNTV